MTRILEISEEELTAQIKLRTYYSYVKTFLLALQQYLSTTNERTLVNRALAAQEELPRFKKLKNKIELDRYLNSQLEQSHARGLLTLAAMKNLPVDSQPSLVLAANLWLPVQAYYALHGMGQAALIAVNGTAPRNHRTFRAAMADRCEFFPWPLSVTVTGGPEKRDLSLNGLSVDLHEIRQTSNIAEPSRLNPELLLGKCLCTTRERLLEEIFSKERKRGVSPGRRYRRLSQQKKEEICNGLHPTTIADFLYRVRVRSNYDDPDMYIFGQNDISEAVEHYQNLCTLTNVLVRCAEAMVGRSIGNGKVKYLRTRLKANK